MLRSFSTSAALVIDPKVPNDDRTAPARENSMLTSQVSTDPLITEMLQRIDEGEICSAIRALQRFATRHYGSPGNREAAAYLHERFSNIAGLAVEYQGGDLRNVIATLPGRNPTSRQTYIVGAHYDSTNRANLNYAPGATDNGGGVAIVLELARVMSRYAFDHTIKFALWNAEEQGGAPGSGAYVRSAAASGLRVSAYFNYDSSSYDPDNEYVLDIMYNDRSRWLADMVAEHNDIYGIGFNLTYNVHDCVSDHRPFWDHGYTAVMTHSKTHGPAHSAGDTIDKISTAYAKKNGQLGMSVVARLATVLECSR